MSDENLVWNKANRLNELERLLRLKPHTATELANRFGVESRTIQRYLKEYEANRGALERQGRKYAISSHRPEFHPVQALAAHAAVRLLYHHAPGFDADYLGALHHLAQRLPEPARGLAERSTAVLETRKGQLRPDVREAANLAHVARAWFERLVLNFYHTKPGEAEEQRAIEVYAIEISRSNLAMYVIGFERVKSKSIRTFKLSRVRHPAVTSETYTIPAEFDPSAYLSDAWGVIGRSDGETILVQLRFAPEAAYRLEEGGYPNLEITKRYEDGSLAVEVTAGTDHTGLPRELLPWILGWGPRVEVVGPPRVREKWLEEAKELLRRYAT